MKSNFRTMIISTMLVVTMMACKDKEEGPKNTYTVDGTSKALKSGYSLYAATANKNPDTGVSYYWNDLLLLTDGLRVEPNNGDPQLKGTGDAVYLGLAGSTQELEAGTYNFTGSDEKNNPFDFWGGNLEVTRDMEKRTMSKVYRFIEGKIIVTKNGDKFTINVDGKVQEASFQDNTIGEVDPSKTPVPFTARYVGALTRFQFDQ